VERVDSRESTLSPPPLTKGGGEGGRGAEVPVDKVKCAILSEVVLSRGRKLSNGHRELARSRPISSCLEAPDTTAGNIGWNDASWRWRRQR
jgi:hypothetical protein